jgi:hypothetical protein
MDRSKAIIRKTHQQGKVTEIKEVREEVLIRTVLSFHPNKERGTDQ